MVSGLSKESGITLLPAKDNIKTEKEKGMQPLKLIRIFRTFPN